ncbi:hypothetical protein DL96DRAFT_1519860 [Flagelloscypha sp. PMI_526]|nr:hypothetical protein DL96DRAFT_1519860 [Flagelloscypha sp. PMI_526]
MNAFLGLDFRFFLSQAVETRRKFLIVMARALLSFGAPSHRIESQLSSAAEILDADTEFVHLPNLVIVSVRIHGCRSTRTYFVRSRGRVALTSLHRVHEVYRDVIHDRLTAREGIEALKYCLRTPPIYSLFTRCFLAFLSASTICALSFGGSIIDMWMSGICASVLQYLGLNAANRSAMYANVYEVSISIIVAFAARALGSLPGTPFCYSAISSAGVVLILPGFTILTSALELMSRNLFCGSVRIVYAIIYTLFLGFGLTLGSDFYLVLDRRAKRAYYDGINAGQELFVHGNFTFTNSSVPSQILAGTLGRHDSQHALSLLYKGCYRDPDWPWWKQPFPWWTCFFLVPLYSLFSSLSNLQTFKSPQLLVMIIFSSASWTINHIVALVLPGRTDIVSATGAITIGILGNTYSRVVGGTAFTSMVTGVLFLVPSGIAQGGGVTQNYTSSAEQYSNGFALALRMISVASGVTIGLFVSQVLVYMFGTQKHAAHMAF